jgi:hypothetical protein
MPVRPQHRELLPDEEARRTVRDLLGHARKSEADRANTALDFNGHTRTLAPVRPQLSTLSLAGEERHVLVTR